MARRLLGRFCEELVLKLQPKAPRAGVASRLLETARQAAQAVQGEDELREVLQGLRAPPAALSAEDLKSYSIYILYSTVWYHVIVNHYIIYSMYISYSRASCSNYYMNNL